MNDGVPRHPQVETMAAFVEGTLAPREVAEVAAHLRECPDCRTAVAETARFYDEERATTARPRPAIGRWGLAAAAIIALAVLTIPLLRDDASSSSPIEALIEAAPRSHRNVEARVSGFPWARLQAPVRGGAAPATPADLKLSGAAGTVLETATGDTKPESQHAAGVAYLLIARTSESVSALERAANQSNDARVWNDLAAAHYALATAGDRPSHLPHALAAADRALRLDARLTEAYFNRALILERLGAREQARAAWRKYLEVDPSSDWSTEARAHLDRLGQPAAELDFGKALDAAGANVNQLTSLARARPEEARRWGEATLLARWAEAQLAHDAPRAGAQLAIVRTIGNAITDRLLADAVAAIDRSTSPTDLATAQQLYDRGRRDYSDRKPGAAETRLRRAAELFHRNGSPLGYVADYYAAQTVAEQRRHELARDELTRLFTSIDRSRHRALAAQIQWQLALVANMANDRVTAAREAAAAAGTFRILGEHANAARLEAMAALALERLGDRDAAWSLRAKALGSSRSTDAVLHSAALSLAAIGSAEAAESMMNLVDYERFAGDPLLLAESLAGRAAVAARAGNVAEAQRRLGDARAAATRIKEVALRTAVDAQIDFAGSVLETRTAPMHAAASAGRALDFFRQRGLDNLVPDAFLQRARAFRVQGRADAAAADYAAALAAVETQRNAIANENQRLAFLDTGAAIVEDAVELHLERGEIAKAFAIVERTRMLAPRDTTAPLGVPRGVAIVEYVVLPKAIAIFVATSDGLRADRVTVDRKELAARVATLAAGVRARRPVEAIQEDAAALHRLLIAPLRLANVEELVLVPDRELYALPFAALYDASQKRFLIEAFPIRFAPSAREGLVIDEGALTPAVVVADPTNPRWRRLDHARAEAEQIAAYHGADVLAGPAATRAAFTEAATRNALVHYAGHADSDAAESYGALVLAAADGDSGILGSSDVARMRLAQRPLVVLAACGTFRGDPLHVGGMSSIARSFLAAGARAVIGTLWEIDDDAAAPLFRQFHESLREGAQPARALRSAQLAMLHSPDPHLRHPATWAVASCIAVNSND